MATVDRDVAQKLIEQGTVWVADAYERDRLGLAGVDAEPAEEIERLVGGSLEAVKWQRRRTSSIATVLLDLCVALAAPDLYADVLNDVLAVGASPSYSGSTTVLTSTCSPGWGTASTRA